MFALHETTQRRVCRVGFLVLCVLPILLTLATVVYCNRPWRQTDWQQTLAQQLHVRAEIENVSRPRPGNVVLTNLQLADLRSRKPLGAIDKLRLLHVDSRWILYAEHLSLEAEQLPALATAMAIWLETHDALPLDFHADRLTIRNASQQDVQLLELAISSDVSSAQRQRFRCTAQNKAGKKIQLVLDCEPQTLRCNINTRKLALPAWLIGSLVPGVSGMSDANFTGIITSLIEAESKGQKFTGKLKGVFDQVDLQTWVGEDCPHRLQSKAQVTLEQWTWTEGRIEFVQGSITANSGASSFSFLENACKLCGCRKGPKLDSLRPAALNEFVPFDRLSLNFQMNHTGIRVVGSAVDGAILSQGQTPLLYALRQDQGPLPVGLLVTLLEYQQQPGWLPATRRAHAMAEKLPLPGDSIEDPQAIQR